MAAYDQLGCLQRTLADVEILLPSEESPDEFTDARENIKLRRERLRNRKLQGVVDKQAQVQP